MSINMNEVIDMEEFIDTLVVDMTDTQKENVYSQLFALDTVPDDIPPDRLLHIFKIALEVLKYKGEQVESVVSEMDNLAALQGEKEARIQNLTHENEELRSQLPHLQSFENNINLDADSMRREIVKLQIKNDQLSSRLDDKEIELVVEKSELEKVLNKFSVIEDENKLLKEQLLATQQELNTQASSTIPDLTDQPTIQKYQELMELLRQKNKHISQLLAEIEEVEKENMLLKDKFSLVQEEMVEGTEHMSRLSVERINLSTVVQELTDKSATLEQENAGLRNQISELVSEKEIMDKQLENLSEALESRVQQWKEILKKKDAEILILKQNQDANFSNLTRDSTQIMHLDSLRETLGKREKEIEELKTQMKQATVDLNESAHLLEQYKLGFKSKSGKYSEPIAVKQLRKKLEQAETRICILESKAKHAEEDASKKAQEVTELIFQLREYESGTFGLVEAVSRIKELQKQKKILDDRIEELTQEVNLKHDEVYQIEQENLVLREKLGIPINAEIEIEGMPPRRSEIQNKILQLTEELEKSTSEVISLKLENRMLHKQLTSLDLKIEPEIDPKSDSMDEKDVIDSLKNVIPPVPVRQRRFGEESLVTKTIYLEDKLKELIDENEGLRKGMHEILDSIRGQQEASTVQVESDCLQRLLEALDSRHINGWYQPAMRLQAQVQLLTGVNNVLREELRFYRIKESENMMELQAANYRIEQLEKGFASETDSVLQGTSTFDHSAAENQNYISKLEQELNAEKEKYLQLNEEVVISKQTIISLKEQCACAIDQQTRDKENWENARVKMEIELELLRENLADDRIKISEYEKHLELLKDSNSESFEKVIAENALRLSALRVELEKMTRKYNILLEVESQTRQKKNELMNELIDFRSKKEQEIVILKSLRERELTELDKVKKILDQSVKKEVYDNLRNDFNELTLKHREWLHKMFLLKSDNDKLLVRLENEMSSIKSQKQEMEIQLKNSAEELNYFKALANNEPQQDQIADFAKKLAMLEVDILNSKQNSDHTNRMYELMKEQLKESENRSKVLEDRLMEMMEINTESLRLETELRNKLFSCVSNEEFTKLSAELQTTNEKMKRELEDIANIAQEQIRSLEYQRKFSDLDYDGLQRRILELQSVSDEKVIIDRLTQELSSLQKLELTSKQDIKSMENKIMGLESNIAYAESKLEKSENELRSFKENYKLKMSVIMTVVYELQKRFLGSLPLINEELWCEDLLHAKEDYINIIKRLTESIDSVPDTNKLEASISFDDTGKSNLSDNFDIRHTQQRLQDLNNWMLNQGLKNEIKIYEERMQRQEELITRLKHEVIHVELKCQEFLLNWNPIDGHKIQAEVMKDSKFTQTNGIGVGSVSLISNKEFPHTENDKSVDLNGRTNTELNQANIIIDDLNSKINKLEEECRERVLQLSNVQAELQRKDQVIRSKDQEITELQCKPYQTNTTFKSDDIQESESVERLALKATVESLQHIIDQKEDTIKRYQNLLKDCRDEHTQNVLALQKELKQQQDIVGSKEQLCRRLNMQIENYELGNERNESIESYLTRIHELEDDLSQATDRITQLSTLLESSNQQNSTAEERRKSFQTHYELSKSDFGKSTSVEINKISGSVSLEKDEEINKLRRINDELKRKLDQSEKLPAYRDRLKLEIERYKKTVEIIQQKENEYKAEIQKLKNQIITRSGSAKNREVLMTPKEELLQKRIHELQDRIEELTNKENTWKETKKAKCDEEVDKWQTRKRYEQTIGKLKRQIKDNVAQFDAQKLNNERLRETIIRMEKEKIQLETKIKSLKVASNNSNFVEELQAVNHKLEEEIKVLRKSSHLVSGGSSMTDVIEAQQRKINILEVAKKGDAALAEQLERLHERKSQLQKSNIKLEEENLQLNLELEKLKQQRSNESVISESGIATISGVKHSSSQNEQHGANANKKRLADLEKAVIVLKRVVEKLQTENKKLHTTKISQLQEKNYTEKLQIDVQKTQENYLDAMEKTSVLENELQTANEKIEAAQKLIDRLQNGEELSAMKSQLMKKNQLLGKIKILLEKTVTREKHLNEKVLHLQSIVSSNGISM